mgnify:FL=1
MGSFEVNNAVCYDDILDIIKLKSIYYQIKKNSKHKDKFVRYELFLTSNLFTLLFILKKKVYHHGRYNLFLISDPKFRIIMSEGLDDKIINHLCSKYLLFPVLERKMISASVATRKEMGTKAGILYIKKYMNILKEKKENFYVLKCDVHKFFYSIDQDVLMQKLKAIYQDEFIIQIMEEIIGSTNYSYINEKIDLEVEKAKNNIIHSRLSLKEKKDKLGELDRIPRYQYKKGLPIGNMTSQILATFYLNDIDHYIKEKLHIKYYIRYMDDFILFHESRTYLQFCLKEIERKLDEVRLHLNNKTQLIEIHQGFNFLGYRFILKGKKIIVKINKKTKRKLCHECKNKSLREKEAIIKKYNGVFKYSDTNGFLFHLKQNN